MKALKTIGIILLILVVAGVVLGLVQPKEYMVERTQVIDASKEQVYNHIKEWKSWDEWSPWVEKDSTIVVTIEGDDGMENSMYKWTSENSGAGSMTNTGSTENEIVNYDLEFTAPRQGNSKGYLKLEDAEEGGTKVIWSMYGQNGFIERIMFTFMDLESMVAPDFDRGLELLKELVETEEVEEDPGEDALLIEELTFEATTYIGLTFEDTPFDKLMSAEFMGTNFGRVYSHVEEKKYEMAGPVSALYHTWDTATKTSTVSFVFPVVGAVANDGDFVTINIDKSSMAVYNFYGDYSKLGDAHDAMAVYLAENNISYISPVIEQYVTDPGQETDTAKWLTKVIYLHE